MAPRPGRLRRLRSKRPPVLTDRQRQVLGLKLAGASFREIGRRLGISQVTAHQHYWYALKKAEQWRRRTGIRDARRSWEDLVDKPAKKP